MGIRLLPNEMIWHGADLSPDGNQVAFVDYINKPDGQLMIYDLASGKLTRASQLPDMLGLSDPKWSPDGVRLLYVAEVMDTNYQASLYITSLEDGSVVCMTPWRGTKVSPAWSSDGKWIAFVSDHLKFTGGYPAAYYKLYLLPTECSEEPATCFEKLVSLGEVVGSKSEGSPAWSADGQHIAFTCEIEEQYGICVTGVDGANLTMIYKGNRSQPVGGLAWSPDGQYIAFTRAERRDDNSDGINNDVFIVTVKDGEIENITNTPFEDEGFAFWMMFSIPFQPGEVYTITTEGDNLNVRSDPSLSGAILKKLKAGDTVTILGGPVQADGYTWWKMRAEDGTEGWAVDMPGWYELVK